MINNDSGHREADAAYESEKASDIKDKRRILVSAQNQ